MDSITIGGLDENEFRRSIQTMLRNGEADDAASTLRALLAPYTGPEKLLPARFLTVSPKDVSLSGWNELDARIGELDRPEHRISALRIAMTEPDPEAPAPRPDSAGRLSPLVETSYFSDTSFPFSEADRNDLLDGYSMDDSAWQGDFEAADTKVKVEGIEDLYGSVAALEARVMASENPDDDEIRAGSLGACYLAVLVHQAVRETVRNEGLPRALCVLAGQDNVYPFFDAPVMACDEYPDDGATTMKPLPLSPASAVPDDAEPDASSDGPYDYGRLSGASVRKARKTPVIMLDAAEANLAAHQVEIEAERQLADADKSENDKPDRASLLAVHDHAAPTIGLSAVEPARVVEEPTPEPVAAVEPVAVAEPIGPAKPEEPVEAVAPITLPVEALRVAPINEFEVAPAPFREPVALDEPVAHAKPEIAVAPPAFEPEQPVVLEYPIYEPALEPPAPTAVRALRARMSAEPVAPPTFGERLAAALRRILAALGLG